MKLVTALPLAIAISLFAGERGKMNKSVSRDEHLAKERKSWFYDYSEKETSPTQISVLINISDGDVKGSQISGITNFADEGVSNHQLSFIYNHANGEVDGVQLSGCINYAKKVDGYQLAHNLNAAKEIRGGQLAMVNFAESVRGIQLGFFNFARKVDGYAIGFFSYSDNGLFHLDMSAEETGMSKITLTTGTTIFTSYSFGYTFNSESNPFSVGMGVGYHKGLGRFFLEGELHGNFIMDKNSKLSQLEDKSLSDKEIEKKFRYNTHVQLKAKAGARLIKNLGVFGGVSFNSLIFRDKEALMYTWSDKFTSNHKRYNNWPGLEFGLRIGR